MATLGALQDAPAYHVDMSTGRLLTATDKSLQEKVLLHGSPPPDLNDVAVDASGGTWLVLYGTGAAYLLGDEIAVLTPANGLCSADILTVAVAPDGAVWFGSYGGGICRRYQDVGSTLTAAAGGLAGDYLADIAVEPDGTVWAATDSMGAARFAGSTRQVFGTANGMQDDHVVALAPHPQPGMYLATRDVGVAFYDGTASQTFAVPPTVPSGRTWAIATHRPESRSPAPARRRAPCDEVWIGTVFGAAYITNGTWTTYTTGSGLPGNATCAIAVDAAVRVSYPRGAVQFHAPSEASSVSASGLTRSSFYLDWDLDVQACDDPLAGASDAHAMLIARVGGDVVPVGRGARLAGVSRTLDLGIDDCSLQGRHGNAGA
ncbi:MAG: hypothetical protein HYV63_26795 [Candidatus Schekmanbacteria bacterium]|nr:hypothetical protein [Candidatus Schekmanbacteria bacterium]